MNLAPQLKNKKILTVLIIIFPHNYGREGAKYER